jgi:Putative restriction endonuclease
MSMQQRILTDEDDPRLATLPAFPTMYDLPSEDPEEPGLPDDYHDLQPQLLSRTLRLSGYREEEVYTAKVSPVVVEFLSPGTEAEDLGRFFRKPPNPQLANSPPSKFMVYEQILKVPHYILYIKRDRRLRHFKLTGGSYQEQSVATSNPRIWLSDLDIGLAVWQGKFGGLPKHWLRWCDSSGKVIPTDTEAALEEKVVAQQQQQQAEAERQQVELKLRQTVLRLHGMGMAIEQIVEITGLTVSEVGAIL